MDREKVIKDLEAYRDRDFIREGITVFDSDPRYRKMIINNALALLKEQDETIKELQNTYGYLQKQFFEAQDKLLKEQDAVEGHRIVLEYCAKDTKDVVNEVIEKLCYPSDDEPGVCRCAMKCQEHTNKNDLT